MKRTQTNEHIEMQSNYKLGSSPFISLMTSMPCFKLDLKLMRLAQDSQTVLKKLDAQGSLGMG